MFPKVFVNELTDTFIKENFKRIRDYFAQDAISRGAFEFLEILITGAVTNFKYPHSLGYQPKDIILMHNLSNTAVTFNYDKFDATNIDITTGGTTTLRLLVGRYE